ncbi:MAG TPA: hypothetical protein VN132_08850 [Bdellovibrio sp.]|nr:hypothetical protein [Bdellovibrio sp.]
MKLFALIIAIAIFMSWYTVHAEEVKVIDTTTPATETTEAPTIVFRDSSEQYRMNKKFTAQWQVVGVGPTGTIQAGLTLGMFLSRNDLVQVEWAHGSNEVNDNALTTWSIVRATAEGTSVGVNYKHFAGNSFYFKGGVDYRTISYEYNDSWSPEVYNFKGRGVDASFLIGNQWQWDNFTLGCDWVGITVPLSHEITEEKITSSQVGTNSDLKKAEDHYLKNAIAQGLRFYMGLSF